MSTIQTCDYCKNFKIYIWEPYHKKYNKKKCQDCLEKDAMTDGLIVIRRQNDLAQARLVFKESLFADACKGYMWFPDAVLALNYEQPMINYESDRVHIYYEPPIIRRLMGRGRLEDVLPVVRAKMMLAIMRQSVIDHLHSRHNGHRRT